MVSLQSALLPEAAKPRPPCLSLTGDGGGASTTATSRKRKRVDGGDDGHEDNSRGEVVDGIELNFDAAPLPPEWQRCLDIKSGQIHYYNTRTHKRTWKDPRVVEANDHRAAPAVEEHDEESANYAAPEGLDLELNLNFAPRRVVVKEKRSKPCAADRRRLPEQEAEDSREMVPAVCMRCHLLVMMCRASPACPNCKFLHPLPSRVAPPPELEPLKLGLRPLCCRD